MDLKSLILEGKGTNVGAGPPWGHELGTYTHAQIETIYYKQAIYSYYYSTCTHYTTSCQLEYEWT